jgi:hypothetical protein
VYQTNHYLKENQMSKSIKSYPENKRAEVIARRVASKTGGLGMLGAQDAQNALIRKAIVKSPSK